MVFWSKIFFFYPKYQETIFSNIISSKTLMRRSVSFGQKPWTNFVGKGGLLVVFATLPLWSKNYSYLSKRIKRWSLLTCFIQKYKWEKVWYWKKTIDNPLWKISLFLALFKTLFFLVSTSFFLSGISKKNIFWLDFSQKHNLKKFRFLDKKHGLSP